MISFTGGPANGKVLLLARAPVYLRVVVATDGSIDALDQLTDEPSGHERIYVYEQTAWHGPVFVCRGPGSGLFQAADYRFREDVEGEPLRDTSAWRAWATAQGVPHAVAAGTP